MSNFGEAIWLLLLGISYVHKCSTQLVGPGPVVKLSTEAGHCRAILDGGPSSLEGAIWVGWDNLLNEPMGPIFNITYEGCKMTPDDKYLLPDGMIALSVKKIHLDRSATFYSDFQSYLQDNKQSINLDAKAGGIGQYGRVTISGSYNREIQEVKKNFQTESSTMLQTKLQYYAYDLPNQLGEQLHPEFLTRLLEIHNATQNNPKKAQYLAQLLIRNYGTHVITHAKIGAIIAQEDYMKKDTNSSSDFISNIDEIKAKASYSFFSMFSFGASFSDTISSNNTNSSKYSSYKRYSIVRTVGGPGVNSLLSASFKPTDDSQTVSLVDDVVPIDRSGIPIYDIINARYLPSIIDADIVREYVFNATEEYYDRNTVYGCTDPTAANFNFQANVNDNNCISPISSYAGFGGIYQTCQTVDSDGYKAPDNVCNKYRQTNGLTNSCPNNFYSEVLFSNDINLGCTQRWRTKKDCGWFTCDYYDVLVTECDKINLKIYWCASFGTNSTNVGFLFGGLFLNGQVNQYTKTSDCAGNTAFQKVRFGLDLNICLSSDMRDVPYAYTLSKIFSCNSPVKACPTGTSRYFATRINDCDISYCSPAPPPPYQSDTYRPLLSPPYLPAKYLSDDTQSSVKIYYKNALLVEKRHQEVFTDWVSSQSAENTTNTDVPVLASDLVPLWINDFIRRHNEQIKNEQTINLTNVE